MDDDLEDKRRQLNQVYNRLEQLEPDGANRELVLQYRALARQLAEEISDLEQREGGQSES